MKKMKKRLTQAEEFDILKLVLDKILWFGFAVMGYGFYLSVVSLEMARGMSFVLGGAVVLVLFMFLLIKEYEVVK
ncbi:TPA: hypothetical protein HA239_02205 [Candidatus Woesearchaeota archaeon]|nr:hypothetical protein QT06_C0001G1045 [archaeon GW2011_AR15]MBS3104484.1 hypothetical protein [Candidatus Woesearchaeota archaeon]HIH41202.1 hypothetical protein [Candidatus Woesearchaeota archaeon]